MIRLIILTTVTFLFSYQLDAQRTISGKVKDSKGNILIGASIMVKGTSIGTTSDIDGFYSLNVPYRYKEIKVSYTGYKDKVIYLGASNIVNVRFQQSSSGGRFYLNFGGSYNFVSNATTNASGLKDDFSERLNYFAHLGFSFLNLRKMSFSFEAGASMRDFGFKQNNSTISYLSIPLNLRLRVGKKNKLIGLELFGGAEYATLLENSYSYIDVYNPSDETYNIFLHQNDAILGTYGGAIRIGKKKIQIFIFSENVVQLDTFYAQFGQTVGSSSLGAAIRYKLF